MRTLKHHQELVEKILEAMAGVVVVDADNKIVYVNQNYADVLGVDPKEAEGQDVRDVIPGTRMPIVIETGREEIGSVFVTKKNQTIIVNRIPVRKDGKVIGAVALPALSKMDELTTTSTMEQLNRLNLEINQYKQELQRLRGAKYSLDQIIGASPVIERVKEAIRKVAKTRSTVLITGETGTGKELIAHAIHQQGPRSHNSFVRLNCSAIPKDLLESEFFGYEDGAFPGAKKGGKPGKFELAHGGSLFLDEIDQLHLDLQSKILRVIQEKEFERVGGVKTIETDVRFIFASNRDIEELVDKGEFRRDLYYRINVVVIHIPPLRERAEDIQLLIKYCLAKINHENGFNILGVTPPVMDLFMAYDWPGNVRELEHVLEGAANIALSGHLDIDSFEYFLPHLTGTRHATQNSRQGSLKDRQSMVETELIIEALKKTKGNKTRASEILKIDRSVLYDKIKRYNIQT